MKRTQVTDLLANIKATFVSFFSIFMFVALGVGVFLGISWASPALENAAQSMLDEGEFHHFQIQYPYGLTDADLAKLAEVEGVTQVEPEYQAFQVMQADGAKGAMVKVQSLGQDIDVPIVVEGELPTKADEMAFHAESAKQLGVSVGDTVTFQKDGDAASTDSAASGSESGNASGMKYLTRSSFKVTAIVDSADYLARSSGTYGYSSSPSGSVDALAWVVEDAFDTDEFQGGYPIVNVGYDGLAGKLTFGDDYKQASSEAMKSIVALGETLAAARYDDLHAQAQKSIDDGLAKIEEAEAQIAQGEQDIADGEKKLEDGRAELAQRRAEGQAQLDDAYQQLMDGEAQKAEGKARLDEAYEKVESGRQAIDDADRKIAEAADELSDAEAFKDACDADLKAGKITISEYNSRLDARGAQMREKLEPLAEIYGAEVPDINHENFDTAITAGRIALANSDELEVTVDGEKMTLGEARQRLATAEAQLADAQAEYDQKVAELDAGWDQYYAGQATLESEVAQAEQELADGEAKLEDAKQQVADGKAQVAESKPQLEEAESQLAAMAKYDWSVLPRAYNAGVAEVSTFSGVTSHLSISMAALFIIVGLLVSYFAVSRIVQEQITQIGTKKALGFRRGEVTASFLWYSGIAVVAGAIVGAIVGFLLVEGIIGGALGDMFAFGTYPAYFGWMLFILITAIELVLVLGATYLACRKILKEHAVELLRGRKPPTGKTRFYEKWGIWEKLPLLIQTIVNNCVNDKRRVLSTIVGVAGCTALIVTAFTLNDDVLASYDRHYANVYGFNAIAYADFEPEEAADNLESAIAELGATTAQAFKKTYLMVQPNGESGAIHVVVPVDEEAFSQLYHVNSLSGGSFDPSAEGAWVSQAYADHFGAKVGDILSIDGGDGTKHEVPILGFYEFWLSYSEAVMGADYFQKEFGEVSPNVVLCQTGDIAVDEVEKAISSVEGFDSIVNDAEMQHVDFDTFSTVSSAVVLIYVVLSVLMAIVVLLNLNVMFIDEKKRELIVLMINGFSVKDARHYISYDNIVLTALGIIVGLLLGCIMGSVTVASIEPITAVFVKSPDAFAIIVGILGSAILAIIMSLIALRRVNNFVLTDINRF